MSGVFIAVQHLFGLGHVRRTARVAQACIAEGMDVTVAAGGFSGRDAFGHIPRAHIHQLPPLKTSDHQYTGLLTPEGIAPDEAYWARRQDVLAELLVHAAPDIVLIELFPFGRRKFASEVLALIETAKALVNSPLIVSSVRDIVEPKTDPAKTREMAGWLKDHFDAVLVHGDESIISLNATAPFVSDAGVPLHYTGYVAPEVTVDDAPKSGVVVSAGSGASGAALLQCAAEVGNQMASAQCPWHLFVPDHVPAPELHSAFAHIHPFTDEFERHLARAEVSISEAGYNTVTEALALGARPVLVPYEGAAQTEQPLRARAFADKGLAVTLPPRDLRPDRLRAALKEAQESLKPPALDLSGAKHAAVILKGLRAPGRTF